jgi:hypothetical protein
VDVAGVRIDAVRRRARFGRRVFYRLTARGRRLRDACAVTP